MNNKVIMKAGTLLKRAGDFANVNSPTIFAGLAIAGVVGTFAMTMRATLKASEVVQEATTPDPDTGEMIKPELKDVVTMTWKYYVPPVLMVGLTIGSIITSNRILNKRNVALAGLYTVSQKALEDYQQKVEDTFGKNKAEKVKDDLAEDMLRQHPLDRSNVIITGFGDHLCYDVLSGRYFKSDIEMVRKSVNDFNFALNVEYNKCLNELYELMNLDSIGLGEEVGWTSNQPPECRFTSKLASDGTPCLVVDHKIAPTPFFRSI